MIPRLRRHDPDRVALIEGERREPIRYRELIERTETIAAALHRLAGDRGLVFLAMGNDSEAVLLYLACLHAKLPVCLCEPQPGPLARLLAAYQPELLLAPAGLADSSGARERESPVPAYRAWTRTRSSPRSIHPDLAMLLPTSGSTGSPKLVRLTLANLEANALAIAQVLELGPGERAAGSLPLHYSYGLSVLNSHLVAGGSLLLTPHSFLRREFWAEVDAAACTSFAGVPYMYETLHRLRWDPGAHRSLRALTQAGGALRPERIEHFLARTTAAGQRLFIMYGQTEATARMSYVPPAELPRKIGSIGVAIPGGALRLEPTGDPPLGSELVYQGPNVMLGYAEGPDDLALGDVQHGVLRTGDLGSVDADGYFRVTGRLKRFAKLFGKRVSLEDVEREVESQFPVQAAALDGGDRIVLCCEGAGDADLSAIEEHVARMLSVPPPAVTARSLPALPRTASGKKDYRALEAAG